MNDFLINLLKTILAVSSPEIRLAIQQAVAKLVEDAKATENPWDDILAGLLQILVGKPDTMPLS